MDSWLRMKAGGGNRKSGLAGRVELEENSERAELFGFGFCFDAVSDFFLNDKGEGIELTRMGAEFFQDRCGDLEGDIGNGFPFAAERFQRELKKIGVENLEAVVGRLESF